MKATGQYFPVMLIKAVITLASVNEVPNEIYEVTTSFDTVCQMNLII